LEVTALKKNKKGRYLENQQKGELREVLVKSGLDTNIGCSLLSLPAEAPTSRFYAAILDFLGGAGKISPPGEVIFALEVVIPLFLFKSQRVQPSSESLSSSSITGSASRREEKFR
jgi:hypothetical protein